MANKLSSAEITAKMLCVPQWSRSGDLIERTFAFPDFIASMRFVNQMATEAERTQHHPDILVKYNKVTLGYSTHDAGGLTFKDFDGAIAADAACGI
ncbi:MAG: 4a-hydroxytetrahydrobiopterin dehydratase [Planctomycetes bacterium]|nr:4a-hydroxytetrahydrobiopterin dehydratase [Planctomycetota bacterium]